MVLLKIKRGLSPNSAAMAALLLVLAAVVGCLLGSHSFNRRNLRDRESPLPSSPTVGGVKTQITTPRLLGEENNDNDDTTTTTLAMVQSNVALGKFATQSSTCFYGSASRAVDGDPNPDYSRGKTISHTCIRWGQWWRVDLGFDPSDEVAIFSMIFHGRDSFQDRMSNAIVEVLNSRGEVMASRSMGNMTSVVTKELEFGNVKGSAVRISSEGRTAICIAELEVMGAELCPTEVGLANAKTVSAGRITLGTAKGEGKLCTLTKVVRNNSTKEVATIIPMARSYDFQEWSNAAGEVPAVAIPEGWNCHASAGDGSATYCAAQLPELVEGEEYVLTSYEHSLPERDQVARLLETATYGPTQESLAEWDFSTPLNLAMAAWVAQQMDPIVTPMTSHREFWRLRANAPTWGSVSVGPAGDPCTSKSRWRKVAYGAIEYFIYRQGVIKTVEPILDESSANITQYLVSVHGQPRTVISEAQKDLSNPPVNFTGFEHLVPNILFLPALGEVGEVDKLQPFNGGYLLETPVASLPFPGLCSTGLPPLEYNGDAIVGRLPDGEWVLLDAVLEQRTNTLFEPLADGGGIIHDSTGGEVLCANVPRTFLNSASCQMSENGAACTLGDGHGGVGALVCGSPGETSNDVSFSQDDSFYYAGGGLRNQNQLWVANSRRDTWSHISIFANDQLRQRMAFALSQIFPIVITDGWYKSENFVNYYDIFVRNAFGNFRTLLKEVSYSPMMATTLTYMQSKSQAFVKKMQKQFSLADENFAREIMQLFTIGTVLLNIDGTVKRDPNSGNEIEAYSNLNIMNFARAWTGFNRQESRGNIEDYQNNIDPMKIEVDWRDKFPISNLDGGYIGDHAYPLCQDLPPKMFLTKGASFRFLGSSKMPETMNLNPEYLVDETMVEVELPLTSTLRALLCDGAGQDCKFQPLKNEIVLSETFSCAAGTIECEIDNVRVVKVADGRYWEYVRPPCVEQAFYEGGKKLGLQYNDQDGVLCANPRLPAAFEACCEFPVPAEGEVCEQCSDGNPCTEDLCSEDDQCINPPVAGCYNGAYADYWYGAKIDSYNSASDAIKNDPRYPKSPDETKLLLTNLSLDSYVDWYGARLRAYIVPPSSGNYTFYIKGDDVGELWLSSDSSSAGLGQNPIAFFTSWTSSFDKFPSQKSQPTQLIQGQVYYLEAFMIEMRGGDHLSVAWESSDAGIVREVIPTSYTQQLREPPTVAHMHNLYDDERVTYDTATARCKAHAAGLSHDAHTCDYSLIDDVETPSHKAGYHWTDVSCQTLIKVTEDKTLPGWIAIVHNITSEAAVAEHVDKSSENFFPAVWNSPTQYPQRENLCGGAGSGCEVLEDGSGCLCATTVNESVGFDAMPPSINHALGKLFIGAMNPSILFQSSNGYEIETDPVNGIVAHKKIGSNGAAAFDQDTVFEVNHKRTGRTFFLKNIVSTVNVVGTSYSFRNAPHFLSLVPTETDLRDAQYQTDAVIDHYFYHENTAPFLARLLIQRFNVASNPSPMYVKTVATAFQKGLYPFDDDPESISTFGSGEYGDLAATISAILLHPEARSPTLDADPASGSVRQPLIKIIAVLRALGLQTYTSSSLARISRTISAIGQGPLDFTTVFSHFLADFHTTGRGGPAGLFAPEEMVLDLPRITGLLNGMYGTMFSWGFNSRYGFGSGWSGKLSLTQSPDASVADVIDEFATLLTAGRLSKGNRALVVDAYQAKYDSTGGSSDVRRETAKKHALELVTSSAEFQTTNLVTMSGENRIGTNDGETTPQTSPNASDYKAVIFLNLGGGVDSFNMLVPHTCVGTEGGKPYEGQTLDEQYQSIRGIIALDKDALHQIDSGSEDQPCTVFGLHPSLSFLASLYDEEDALFVANAGYMSDPDFTKTVGHVSGHSSMSHYAEKVDAFSRYGDTGVLGRMRDVLISKGKEKTSAISIDRAALSVVGQSGRSQGPVTVGVGGVAEFPKWVGDVSFMSQVESLNNATAPDSGFMAELWSSKLHHSISVTDALRGGLEGASLVTPFALNKMGNPLGEQLKMVSRLQQVNAQRGITRDFYNVYYGSFDHHGGLAGPLDSMFKLVDEALTAFVTELKALNLWESTVIVETSEFARTLYPNGNAGTDHGWGGHYFVIGGPVKGGRIIGKYPKELWGAMKAWGRRVVPTTPWDAIWSGVAEWMGIDDAEGLKEVCPNREKFDIETLFNATTMFTSASCTNSGGICTMSVECCSLFCHGDGFCR